MRLPVFKPLYLFLKALGCPVAWEVSCGGIVFFQKGKEREYLLIRYPSGHFDYARGHMEEGETRLETASREILEEIGLDPVKFFDKESKTRFFYVAKGNERMKRLRDKRGIWIFKEVHMFPAEVDTQTITLSHEHTEFVWLPYDQALQKVTFENAKRILRETENFLSNNKV